MIRVVSHTLLSSRRLCLNRGSSGGKSTIARTAAAFITAAGLSAAAVDGTTAGLGTPAAQAQTAQEIREGIEHAATTPGGAPVHGYDPFYDEPVPADQLDRPGKILRTQPAPHLLNILGPNFYGHAKRILYTSTTVHGEVVPVSGAIIEPANPWRGKGPRPTVVFGPGTRGSGDACAPSRGTWMLGQANLSTGSLGTNYELPSYQAAALMGMRVVVTDYIGLGTPGGHMYVLHEEEGHAMLDAARATTSVEIPVGFWGYSQGGGAAAAAAELASTYAPELNVKATFSGAPPADLPASMRGVDGSTITSVLGFAINAWQERYPELGPVLEPIFTDRGREFLAATADACIADSALKWDFSDTRQFTTSGKPLSEAVVEPPAMRKLQDAQKLGRRLPTGPIMVSTAGHDDVVPSDQVAQMARDHCALGANLTYYDSALPPLTPGLKTAGNHVVGIFTHVGPSMQWMFDRFNDVPNHSNCGTF